MRLFRSQDEKQQAAAVKKAFASLMAGLAGAEPARARALARETASDPTGLVLNRRERQRLGGAALDRYADTVLADDHLTKDEEDAFLEIAEVLGFGQEEVEQRGDLYERLQVAKLNDGRLPTVASPRLLPKKGETVHFETSATLVQEVAVREWRGGSQGVSFRVAKGVRYRVGSTRGHLVTVGSQLQAADTGLLVVSSKRAAFLGSRKTIDMPYTKIIGFQLYNDGIKFSLSNRQNAPLLRVEYNINVLGALLNAAIQAAS